MNSKEINFIKRNGDIFLNLLKENEVKTQRQLLELTKEKGVKKIKSILTINRLFKMAKELNYIEKVDGVYVVLRDL